MTEFPRVLCVTPQSFNHLTGGGITFSNLFFGWPKDRIATAHGDDVPTSGDVCDKFFLLGRPEIDLFAPLRIVRAIRDRKAQSESFCLGVGTAGAKGGGFGLIARMQGDSAPQRARLSPALTAWIADFKPQLLYTTLGSNAYMEMVGAVRRKFDLPLVVHVMDDFPAINYQRGIFARYEYARMQRLIAENCRVASACMGICADMCAALSERYGSQFLPFQNCVDVERWGPLVRSDSVVKGNPPRLLYFGSIFANAQLASLVDVCHSVARLNEGGVRVLFEIAASAAHLAAYHGILAVHPAIRLIEATQDDGEYFLSLAAADALVLPINYDDETVAFIRYSMPTKVPAYMASGTPILVYGPRGTAQVDYAARESWGHVVCNRDPSELDSALPRLLSDVVLREGLRTRAQALAAANHDSLRVRARFQDALKSAARAGR